MRSAAGVVVGRIDARRPGELHGEPSNLAPRGGGERTAPAVQIVLLALLVGCHRRANGAPHVEQSRLRGPRETMYQAAH
jgi:hypothetical protein